MHFYPPVSFDVENFTVGIHLEVGSVSSRDDREGLILDESTSKAYSGLVHVIFLLHTPLRYDIIPVEFVN